MRVAGGGEEALRLAGAEPFDMALVDLRMPDLDGLGVLKQLGAALQVRLAAHPAATPADAGGAADGEGAAGGAIAVGANSRGVRFPWPNRTTALAGA